MPESQEDFTTPLTMNSDYDFDVDLGDIDWKELADVAAIIIGAITDSDNVSSYMMVREVQEQNELIENGYYASAVLRQSAFYETLLTGVIEDEFEDMVGRDLENAETNLIEHIGIRNRIRLAHLIGLIDRGERDSLLNLASWRNKVAHEWWFVSNRGNEKEIEDVAREMSDMLIEMIEDFVENSDGDLMEDIVDSD